MRTNDFNFNAFMEDYASEIGGQFSEYDQTKSVIIVPLDENRFQAVLGVMKFNEKFNKNWYRVFIKSMSLFRRYRL
jgi:hypothetical protein